MLCLYLQWLEASELGLHADPSVTLGWETRGRTDIDIEFHLYDQLLALLPDGLVPVVHEGHYGLQQGGLLGWRIEDDNIGRR